jgi:hypothetical protein
MTWQDELDGIMRSIYNSMAVRTESQTDPKLSECEHQRWGYVWDGEDFVGVGHRFCPKCGEEL